MKDSGNIIEESNSDDLLGRLSQRLSNVGLTEKSLRAAGTVVWRAILLGSALYLALTPDQDANLRLNMISYIVALVWSYYDGVFSRGRWSFSAVEGIFLHLIGVQVGNLLALMFGNPVLSP
ncbi:hypothetical protein GCM10007972_13090 [Iodidimonas muriae]|uniref:Uncharacterized protein n=1 Tax=Iodidimonas muriae TaxID=261467 RepID=A0ABQ2LCF4_9PROT|nr:hypothetical protein [Iodidimonas muriae]GER06684.1 hypothetical protein JCM17843_09940 [Kordiimonadales bacterium JCM 17843]GGO10373.1 hypothetical protein GCM10007972_13090 [Iodidimonas muriae]